MTKIEGLTINEATYDLQNGEKGKLAVFIYTGIGDPSKALEWAVSKYCGKEPHHELIDAELTNPWMRVVVSNINEIPQEVFDVTKHRIKKPTAPTDAEILEYALHNGLKDTAENFEVTLGKVFEVVNNYKSIELQ